MSEKQDQMEEAPSIQEKCEGQMETDVLLDNQEGGSEAEQDDDDEDDDDDPGEEHEFEIIDQVESEEENGENEEGRTDESGKDGQEKEKDKQDNSYGYTSSSDDLDDSEVHEMLEKVIDEETQKKQEQQAEGRPIIKHKTVLREFESDPFDILPVGWVCVTHNCGMPVYLHKETRVCAMARPYSLGSASTRMHDIPISAIPCLQYRRQMEKEEANNKVEAGESSAKDEKVEETKNTQATPADTQESNTSIQPITLDTPTHPVPAGDPKPSPQKMWVVAEESFRKELPDSQKEALHTGTRDFKCTDDGHLNFMEDSSSIVRPHSPGGENIDVSLNSSRLLNNSDSSCSVVEGIEFTQSAMPLAESSTAVCPFSVSKKVANTADFSSSQPACNKDSDKHNVSESSIISSEFPVQEKSICSNEAKLHKDIDDSLEEGEIIDEEDIKDKLISESGEQGKVKPALFQSSVISSTVPSTPGNSTSFCDSTTNSLTTSINNIAHVVREEATSSLEPSELITSNSNSLATIKRKIESLKSKRGGKLRRVDNGSAVGWHTENNIAVTPLKMGIGNASNAALNASANEKLKAHAAGVKIKSAEERAKESLLNSTAVHNYCTKLFQFKTLEVKKYRSWRERRKHLDERSRHNRPELPLSTKLITCPIPGNMKPEEGGENVKKREFILNPTGKSYLCILHEYMQRTLKIQPLYVFRELENSKTPYGATVTINGIEYGTGYASSKKVAKQEAAKETLKVLIPDLFKKISDQEIKRNISDLSFFDEIKVTDPRVNDLGNKVGQPSPFQLLLECLRRNFGMGNTQCDISTQPLKNQKCEFTIKVGKHSATVVAKNKREGKQLAAQAILAKLHPHVPSWGSLLRLYGTSVVKPIQKPEEMNDIKSHIPNNSVLESLREEMRKLHRQKEAIQSKGKIIISSKDLPNKVTAVDL